MFPHREKQESPMIRSAELFLWFEKEKRKQDSLYFCFTSNSSLLISPKYVQFNILKMCWQLNPFNGKDYKQTISNLVNKRPQETGFI